MIEKLAIAIALACALPAQRCVYTGSETPFQQQAQAGLFFAPSGTCYYRHQLLIPATIFGNVPLCISEMSVAIRQGWQVVHFPELRIRMAHTTQTTLALQFAQNITSPLQDVLVVDDHVMTLGIGPAWVPVGMQQAFHYSPALGNLLIDIVEHGGNDLGSGNFLSFAGGLYGEHRYSSCLSYEPTSANSQIRLPPAIRFCVDQPASSLHGLACSGGVHPAPLLGLTGEPVLGGQSTFWLNGVPPSSLALLVFGFENNPPYPVDLTILGAPGCTQYFNVEFTNAVLADSFGVGQDALTIPTTPDALGLIILGQYLAVVPTANPLGALTTNYARLLVGR